MLPSRTSGNVIINDRQGCLSYRMFEQYRPVVERSRNYHIFTMQMRVMPSYLREPQIPQSTSVSCCVAFDFAQATVELEGVEEVGF